MILSGVDYYGLGDGTGAQIAGSVPGLVGGILLAPGIVGGVSSGVAGVATGTSLAAAIFPAAIVPLIGPAIVGITIALTLIFSRKGPKQKTAATAIVNDVEPLLRDNVTAYLSGPRTVQSQKQAIQNFLAGWQGVLDNCGVAALGNPGKNCISERQEGAHPHWDGCPPEGCQNWFQMYLDPIRNDTPISASGSSAGGGSSVIDASVSVGGADIPLLPLLIGGGLLVGVMLWDS